MAIDPLTISLITVIFAGIGAIILKLHIKTCNLCCINSDCSKSRSNSTADLDAIDSIHPSISVSPIQTPNTNRKVSDV
jgi:hypothetical protein